MPRDFLKLAALAGVDRLTRIGAFSKLALRTRGDALPVFLLHRMENRDCEIRGYREERLGRLLDSLQDLGARFLSLAEVVEIRRSRSRPPAGALAFTADDGYFDQAERLAPVFVERNIPLTVFLISDLLDGKSWPWDARIAHAVHKSRNQSWRVEVGRLTLDYRLGTPAERLATRHECQALAKTLMPDELERFIQRVYEAAGLAQPEAAPDPYRPMSWSQARELEAHGVSFAPHSATHRIMTRLSDEEVRHELVHSWSRLDDELQQAEKIIAWPVGRPTDYGMREMVLARELGFKAAFSASDDFANARDQFGTFDCDRFGLDFEDQGQSARRIFLGVASRQSRREKESGARNEHLQSGARTRGFPGVWGYRTGLAMRAANAAALFGRYPKPSNERLAGVQRIVFVCQGNICRSPYAAVRARQRGIDALSCGLRANGVAPADPTAARVAFRRGLDLSGHCSLSVDAVEFRDDDLVLAMEPSHLPQIRACLGNAQAIANLLGLWSVPSAPWIPDPYGRAVEAFEEAFTLIDKAIVALERELSHRKAPEAAAGQA